MRPDDQRSACRDQRGFTLVWAIFLLVVLASLGAYMVRVSAVQHSVAAQALQAARAYHAARGGIEWARYRLVHDRDCRSVDAAAQWLFSAPGLQDFQVQLECTERRPAGGVDAGGVFELNATASHGTYGQPGYVRRMISATVSERAPRPGGDTLVYLREVY